MTVERLSLNAFEKIVKGKTRDDTTCVIKFYSVGCPFCEALKETYEEIADAFHDVYFFAFNVADHPNLERLVSINGVPTISMVRAGTYRPEIIILGEPKRPHEATWYHRDEIKEFVERNMEEKTNEH
jgi:thiol-disulfide isomerase/thioredoxin